MAIRGGDWRGVESRSLHAQLFKPLGLARERPPFWGMRGKGKGSIGVQLAQSRRVPCVNSSRVSYWSTGRTFTGGSVVPGTLWCVCRVRVGEIYSVYTNTFLGLSSYPCSSKAWFAF